MLNAAQQRTVASPNLAYETHIQLWEKSRAVSSGERFVKKYDRLIDPTCRRNLLIPFSPTMTQEQFDFYKAEAELPGIVAQFTKMLIGGLLRKKPSLELPDSVPDEAKDWIINEFGQDDSPITFFLENTLDEELKTSRAWIYVDYPVVERDDLTREEKIDLKPYPILWPAEKVINWHIKREGTGKIILDRIITRELIEDFSEMNEFHPTYIDEVRVHELVNSRYQVRVFQKKSLATDNIDKKANSSDTTEFKLTETFTNILVSGKPLDFIPAWPANGNIDIVEPILMSLIDKEVSIYNKLSRRNHLLYGASTYTPIIIADINDEDFDKIINSGLGSWLKLPSGSEATVLETPTAALADMDRAIAASIEEMAKLGIRMLTPETDQSGAALQIRNAAQTAQLGSLNNKISNVFSQIICFMINWRYGIDIKSSDIKFSLSADFDSTPLNEGWLRLVAEWYQQGLLPRSVWLQLLKNNDIVPGDYNDDDGQKEINEDQDRLMSMKESDPDYQLRVKSMESKLNKVQ